MIQPEHFSLQYPPVLNHFGWPSVSMSAQSAGIPRPGTHISPSCSLKPSLNSVSISPFKLRREYRYFNASPDVFPISAGPDPHLPLFKIALRVISRNFSLASTGIFMVSLYSSLPPEPSSSTFMALYFFRSWRNSLSLLLRSLSEPL